jgi:hypothetical protein
MNGVLILEARTGRLLFYKCYKEGFGLPEKIEGASFSFLPYRLATFRLTYLVC